MKLHTFVAVGCHQDILRIMLNLRSFQCRGLVQPYLFETVDTLANFIVEHFNQKDYTKYANCEQVLLKGTKGELVSQNVDQLCEFYTEFDSDTLRNPLSRFAESYHSSRQGEGVADTLHNVVDFLKKEQKDLVPHARGHVLVKIVVVMPATNASSKYTFYALRRVKSYLCTTMLNNCHIIL